MPDRQDPRRAEEFKRVEERLRKLGASYYSLEAWGDRGTLFRFRCRVPIAGSPEVFRYFEAAAPDALEAMTQVLRGIEGWRGAL